MAKGRKSGAASKFLKLVVVLLIGAAIGAVAVTVFFTDQMPVKKQATPARLPNSQVAVDVPPITTVKPGIVAPTVVSPDVPTITIPPISTLPKLAIVIDDMGQDMGKLNDILNVGAPITIAVLPHLKHSTQTANEARDKGLDVLLHLPMEPQSADKNEPGKGALWIAMTPAEIRSQIEKDFQSVPNAIGVNNHMGSKFTEDAQLMAEVMGVMKKRNLFFLDSKTTSRSVAANSAVKAGVENIDRNVFLDNVREVSAIKERIAEAVKIAKKRGSAVAIGHPYPETIAAIREYIRDTKAPGVEIAKITDVIKAKKADTDNRTIAAKRK